MFVNGGYRAHLDDLGCCGCQSGAVTPAPQAGFFDSLPTWAWIALAVGAVVVFGKKGR